MSTATFLAPILASLLAPPEGPPTNAELDAAKRGRLGMQVRGVEIDTGEETYRLTERSWGDVVRDNPALLADQRRTELFAPGLAGVGLGGLWLTIATAVTIDDYARRRRNGEEDRSSYWYDDDPDPLLSARSATFRFIIPGAILITGAAMAIVGGRARRRLGEARRAFYLGPQLSQRGGGLTVGGRF